MEGENRLGHTFSMPAREQWEVALRDHLVFYAEWAGARLVPTRLFDEADDDTVEGSSESGEVFLEFRVEFKAND